VADAAALGAILSILMKLFPKYVTTIVSWTEMLFGLGFMLGETSTVCGDEKLDENRYKILNNYCLGTKTFKIL
jgi:hypothetical protein